MSTSLRLFGLALLLLIALAVCYFYRRTQLTFVPIQPAQPGVVFTGRLSHVHAGLDLLESNQIAPILISGVYQGAGIPVAGFADQFQLSLTLWVAIAAAALVLATDPNHTIENARERRHWLTPLSVMLPIELITNQFHMPRASLALEEELESRQVLR